MTTFQKLQRKISEELNELYEAFYAAQEWIEEGRIVKKARSHLDSLHKATSARISRGRSRVAIKS